MPAWRMEIGNSGCGLLLSHRRKSGCGWGSSDWICSTSLSSCGIQLSDRWQLAKNTQLPWSHRLKIGYLRIFPRKKHSAANSHTTLSKTANYYTDSTNWLKLVKKTFQLRSGNTSNSHRLFLNKNSQSVRCIAGCYKSSKLDRRIWNVKSSSHLTNAFSEHSRCKWSLTLTQWQGVETRLEHTTWISDLHEVVGWILENTTNPAVDITNNNILKKRLSSSFNCNEVSFNCRQRASFYLS